MVYVYKINNILGVNKKKNNSMKRDNIVWNQMQIKNKNMIKYLFT